MFASIWPFIDPIAIHQVVLPLPRIRLVTVPHILAESLNPALIELAHVVGPIWPDLNSPTMLHIVIEFTIVNKTISSHEKAMAVLETFQEFSFIVVTVFGPIATFSSELILAKFTFILRTIWIDYNAWTVLKLQSLSHKTYIHYKFKKDIPVKKV